MAMSVIYRSLERLWYSKKSDIDLELMPTGVREVIVLEKSSASTNLLLFFHCKELTTENTLGKTALTTSDT